MTIVEEAAIHARQTHPAGDLPHIAEVVAYVQQLAAATGADVEIVTIAAYFHDISRASTGPEEHNVKSAQMAREWLNAHAYPAERVERVSAAIVAHMRPIAGEKRGTLGVEGRILYDADKLSRAQGLGIVGALVRLGEQASWEKLSHAQLAATIRKGRDLTQEAYGTLYTDAARELAAAGHLRAIEFCDALLGLEVLRT